MRSSKTIVGLLAIWLIYFLNYYVISLQVGGVDKPFLPFYGITLAIVLSALWYVYCSINMVDQRVRRPVFLFGKYQYTAGPGLCFIEPVFYSTDPDVPVQDVVEKLSAPEVQTKDNVGLGLEAALTFRIDENNVGKAVVEVENVMVSVVTRAVSILTDMAGTKELDDLLQHREVFSAQVVKTLQDRVGNWGVTIKAFEIRSFKINDHDLVKAIAMRARAQKEGEAEVTRASYALKTVEQLNKAGEMLTPEAKFLRLMEQLSEMSRGPNNTMFVIPSQVMDVMSHVIDKK